MKQNDFSRGVCGMDLLVYHDKSMFLCIDGRGRPSVGVLMGMANEVCQLSRIKCWCIDKL